MAQFYFQQVCFRFLVDLRELASGRRPVGIQKVIADYTLFIDVEGVELVLLACRP